MKSEPLKRLKVAVVGPLPPPAGGMANQARELVELLEQAGLTISFVRTNPPYKPDWVSSIKGLRALFRLLPYLFALWRTIGKVDLVHVLANSGWSWHLFAAPAVWVARLRNKPVVLNYRGGEADTFFRKAWLWVRPTLQRCQAIIVPSAFLQRVFAQRDLMTSIVPNILDLARFDCCAGGRESHLSPHLIVTRNLEPIYGVDTVIKAFAMIKTCHADAHLTIAGSGPQEAALKSMAAELSLGDSVSFVGWLGPAQIADLYRGADVLLNASIVDNSPNSLIEALACGVPVVSSNAGGIPDLVVHERSALLVAPGQAQALAEAALRVLEDNTLRERLIEEGRKVAARFDKNQVLASLLRVYSQVTESG